MNTQLPDANTTKIEITVHEASAQDGPNTWCGILNDKQGLLLGFRNHDRHREIRCFSAPVVL